MWPIATYVDQNLVKVAGKRCTRSSPPSPTPTLACCYAAGWALVVTLWLLPKWWGQAIYENRAAPRFLGHRRRGGGSSQMMMMQRAIVPISRWAALPVVLFLSLFLRFPIWTGLWQFKCLFYYSIDSLRKAPSDHHPTCATHWHTYNHTMYKICTATKQGSV